jgi:amidophosphoribosyltransferase
MGRLGDAVVFASETCAFDLIGASYERDVKPGEIVEVSARGIETHRIEGAEGQRISHCIFEHIYFARPDSRVFGENRPGGRTGRVPALSTRSVATAVS